MLPTYSTGTVSVSNGDTTVTVVGGIWSGINVREGDFIKIGDFDPVLVTEATDTTHLEIPEWLEATQSGVPYTIYQNYVGRVVGVAAAKDVGDLIELFSTAASTQGDNTFTGVQTFSNDTEATGLGVASALFAGGVEIAKKLFVTGDVDLASALDVTGDFSVAGVSSFTNTTEATGSGTASALFAGGVEIAKKLFVTGNFSPAGVSSFTNATEATGSGTASALFAGGIEIAKKLFVAGVSSFTNTTEATGSGTASALFAGGVEIAKKLFVAGTVALASTLTVTSSSASALTAGLNGATNPAFAVDASTASSATGLRVKSAAAAAGLALAVLSSGTNENLTVDAKGSGTITLNGTATGSVTTPRVLAVTNATAATSTSTGSATFGGGIGVAGSGWFGTDVVTPIVRSSANVEFQVNGTTFAGRVDTQRRWFFGLNATHNGAAGTIMQNANSASTIPSTGLGFNYLLVGADNAGCALTMQAFHTSISSPGAIQFFKARGTAASPTATQNGDFMGQITAYGYRTSPSALYDVNGAAGIYMVATDNYTSTALGMQLRFLATPAGTATSQFSAAIGAGMTIGGTGNDPGTGCLRLLGTTATTSATTGTLICDGGVGIAGALYVGANIILKPPSSAAALSVNGEVTFQLTSNTALAFKARGSDGTTRTGTITLS